MHYLLRAEAGDDMDGWLTALESFARSGALVSPAALSLVLRQDPHADCFLFDWPEASDALRARAAATLPGAVEVFPHDHLEPDLQLTRLAALARRTLVSGFEPDGRKEALFRELLNPALIGLGESPWAAMQFHLNCALSTAHGMDESLAERLGLALRGVLESYVGGAMEV